MRAVKLVLACLVAAPVSAQAVETSTRARTLDPAARARLKEKLRVELAQELKEELRSELAVEGPPVVAEAQPETPEQRYDEPDPTALGFFELDGYFRFRYALGQNWLLCPSAPSCTTRAYDDAIGAGTARLRIEPTLNVYEDVKIKAQIDVLDNLVLGSTPNGFPADASVFRSVLAETALPPSDQVNALFDSIRVKRLWAEVMTPLGQLRVGRMSNHFGMGLVANGGLGLDSDLGDTADSIRFATRIGDHYIIPGFDWVSSGPTSGTRLEPFGQPFDRSQIDDVDQFLVLVSRFDSPEDIAEQLDRGADVLNYGGLLTWRTQLFESNEHATAGEIEDQATVAQQERRGVELFTLSLWGKWMFPRWFVEAELVGTIGSIDRYPIPGRVDGQQVDVLTLGGAVRGEVKLLGDALTLRMMVLAASGDGAHGFGVRTLDRTSTPTNPNAGVPVAGAWDGPQNRDGAIHNFVFDPDLRVDLILWREWIGAVTDAVVFRPGIEYRLIEALGARLDLVYSRALLAESTPSAAGADPSYDLGLELDAKLFYDTSEGFHAWLEYGVLFPLGGLQAPGSEFAVSHSLRATLAVTF